MKHPYRIELKNFVFYNNLCKEMETSIELDTINYIEKFSSINCDVNNWYKKLSNLKYVLHSWENDWTEKANCE